MNEEQQLRVEVLTESGVQSTETLEPKRINIASGEDANFMEEECVADV